MSLSVSPVRLPRLLDANDTVHPFSEITRLHPSRLSVSIKRTPLSSADMELTGEDAPVRSFAELYTIHGSAGIYRAAQVETDYADDSSRVAWEHGICTLGDVIYTEKEEQSKTVTDMLNTLLGLQGERAYWTVGRVETGDTVTLTPNGQTVLDLLLTMMEQLPDYMLAFDQSSFPWLLSIVRKPQEITAEGRLSRNLSSVRVQYDDSELCTRVYANGLENGYMDSDNVATYGLVEHSLTLSEDIEQAEAETIASRYLEKRDTPAVAIEIDAVDLSLATGEALDAFTISKRFRLALPAYGQTFEEDIIGIEYADVFGEPERVTLELANEIADINEKTRKAQKVAAALGGVSGIAATQNTIIKQDTKMETYDKYITALEDKDILVMREDHAKVEVGNAMAEIFAMQRDVYENTNKTDIVSTLKQAGITVEADEPLVEIIAKEIINRKNATDTNFSQITVNKNNITLYTTGQTMATSIMSTMLSTELLRFGVEDSMGDIVSWQNYKPAYIGVVTMGSETSPIPLHNILVQTDENLNAHTIDLQHYHAISVVEDPQQDGKMIVTLGPVKATEQTANFNIADTEFYKKSVSAAVDHIDLTTNYISLIDESIACSITAEAISADYDVIKSTTQVFTENILDDITSKITLQVKCEVLTTVDGAPYTRVSARVRYRGDSTTTIKNTTRAYTTASNTWE